MRIAANSANYGDPGRTGNRGVALIITLWVLVLLSVLALGFSSTVRRGSKSARNFAEDTRLHFIALSAYEEALLWLASDPDPHMDFIDEDGLFHTDQEREPISGLRSNGISAVEITVSDEEARLNLNILNQYTLRRLLEHASVPEEKIPELMDTFMDWRDSDDLHRLNGAEDEYYEPLGYRTKNANFDSPMELLLVKGFREAGVVNSLEPSGPLLSLVSAWGQGVNVNTAPSEILDILGLDPKTIEAIMEARREGMGIKGVPAGLKHKGKTSSSFYRVEVKAWFENSPWAVTLTAVVKRYKGPDGEELRPVYWKEGRETRST